MAANFQLPDTAPPGNVFPSYSQFPTPPAPASGAALTVLKADTRQVVVAVTEANTGSASTSMSNEPAETMLPPQTSVSRSRPETPQGNMAPPPPQASVSQASVSRSRPETPQGNMAPPPASGPTSCPGTPQRNVPPQLTIHTGVTPQSSPPGHSHSSSDDTLVRKDNDDSDGQEQTPVMRSMFPRFDPAVPLPQQNYVPTAERVPPPPPTVQPAGNYSPSLYSQPRSPPTTGLGIPRMSIAMAASSPLRIAEEPPPDLSTGEELLDLWSLANGQDSVEAKETYTLGLHCEMLALDHEAIHFVSSTSSIYTLHASGSTVILTRTHPLNPSTEITICTPQLGNPSVTSPLLATIFPCLAELMALDTASNIALTHRLTRQDSMDLQAEALRRSQESEAAALLWDSDSAAYYLAHPSLSTATSDMPATLPITINPGSSISLLNPAQEPVLSLSLTTQTLTIHVSAMTALSPSLYTLDTLISTMMTLLLHLHRKTHFLVPQHVPLPHFDPPPTARPLRAQTRSSSSSRQVVQKPEAGKLSRWLSVRTANNAARSSTPNSFVSHHSQAFSTLSSPYLGSIDPKDLEAGINSPIPSMSMPIPALPAAGVAPELRKETTGVDLSRFQAYDLSDPELGRGTKAILRVIYWGFGVLVWILGVGVGVLAACVVAFGGCVGGGKGGSGGRTG